MGAATAIQTANVDSTNMNNDKKILRYFSLLTLSLWSLLFIVLLFVSIHYTGGHLIYTLDDPYIHLAVARNILLGGYGVNVGEYSSPSSSILWPWIMAALEAIGLGMISPIIINALSSIGTIFVACLFLIKNKIVTEVNTIYVVILGVLVILLTSSLALPFTGMEHSLHVLLTVAALDGLIDTAEGRKTPWYFIPALVLLPFVRFEGFPLSGTSILALLLFKRYTQATVATSLILFGISLYVAFATIHNLPFFPSSVLIKSPVISALSGVTQSWYRLIGGLIDNLLTQKGKFFALTALFLLFIAFRTKQNHPRMAIIYLGISACIGAQLFVGQIGWFYRYEVYCVAICSLMLLKSYELWPFREKLASLQKSALVVLLLLVCATYAKAIYLSPLAARNIYEQQYQMRRFVLDYYKGPVAVNDLGLVSYANPYYVLDLWGLGSEAVRKLRASNVYNADAMARLAFEKNIGLVMIYDKWFPEIPLEWTRVATLTIIDSYVAGDTIVSFYATPKTNISTLHSELERFTKTVPPRVKFNLTYHSSEQ